MREKIVFLKNIDGIEYYSYKPSLLKLYYDCYISEDVPPYFSRVTHRLRMMREQLRSGYQVVYMSVGDKIVGHLVVSRGGSRIEMSTPEDILIGPIWTVPSERNKGYASAGIGFILSEMGIPYDCAYEYISADNAASIRTVEKNGFVLAARCREFGLLKTIKEDESGDLLVFRYDGKNDRRA